MAYGYGESAKEPKNVAKEEKQEKKAPAMPKKQSPAGMDYAGGTHKSGMCYSHSRKSSQK